MNRRSLLTRALALVGAVALAPAVKTAEAAPVEHTCADCSGYALGRQVTMNTAGGANIIAPTLATAEASTTRAVEAHTGTQILMRSTGIVDTSWAAMVADCESKGHELIRNTAGWGDGMIGYTHMPSTPIMRPDGATYVEREEILTLTSESHLDHESMLTGWLWACHMLAPVIVTPDKMDAALSDARAEGYNAGHLQATQRAESRVALGLPLSVDTGLRVWGHTGWSSSPDYGPLLRGELLKEGV
jgi:hypothetical protein